MSDDSKRCPRCGAALTADAPQGLCPKCLAAGLAAPTEPGTGPHGTKILQPAPALDAVRAAFPQLEVLQLIGRGGMGVVYQARQKSLNRLVALKLLAPERVTDAKFAERFTREAQALARLSHPNIVTIHDFGVATPPQTPDAIAHPPFYFLLMEFVDGVNLRQAMKAGRFTPEQALAIVPPVCDALQYAHERGIVHRDIKPENLLLDKDGRVKIADFGIAKILGADGDSLSQALSPSEGERVPEGRERGIEPTLASAAGTPQYMAPEQREHHRTDHRADIYSLGVVLYELLTGELPGKRLEAPSRKVQIDVRLDEIVLRALETKPELRFQTAGEFRTQLETLATPGSSRREEASSDVASRLAPPHVDTPTPWTLVALVLVFFGYGFLSAWETVADWLKGNPYLNLGIVGIPIGVGLLRRRMTWRYGAIAVSIYSVIALTILCSSQLTHPGIKTFTLFGIPLSAWSLPIWGNLLFLALHGWMLWVLTRPSMRSLFAQTSRPGNLHSETGRVGKDQSLVTSAPTGRLWHGPALVLAIIYAGLLWLLFTTASQLPPRVAIHFDFKGRPNDWASDSMHLWWMALLPVGLTALLVGVTRLVARFPRLANIPRRDYWLAPERRAFTANLLLRWMLILLCPLTVFFGALHWLTLQANLVQPPQLSTGALLSVIIGFLVAILLWIAMFLMRLAEVERYEAALTKRFSPAHPFSARKHLMSAALTLAFIFIARAWLANTYVIKTDALAPELPAGSVVLAWKATRTFAPGDLIVYRHEQGYASVGRVTGSEPDAVLVNRNGQPGFRVERAKINGKVISVLWRGAGSSRDQLQNPLGGSFDAVPTPSSPDLVALREKLRVLLYDHEERQPEVSRLRAVIAAMEQSIRAGESESLARLRSKLSGLRQDYSDSHPAVRQVQKEIEAELAKAPAGPSSPPTTTNSLLALGSVESARSNLATFKLLVQAGRATPLAVLEAEQHLQWAEAMHAGDRVAAARAKRDGARRRLDHLEGLLTYGRATRAELAPIERELAEAEAQLAALTRVPATPQAPPAPDPTAAIEMKVALQQLEKTLTSIEETQAEMASLQSSLGVSHPKMEALRSKMDVLEKQAARLRSVIQESKSKQ